MPRTEAQGFQWPKKSLLLPLTAFIIVHNTLYEWVYRSFGSLSSRIPGENGILFELRDTICLLFLDGNLVHSSSFEA